MASGDKPQTHRAIKANIAFLQDNPAFATEKPYLYLLAPNPGFPVTNCFFASNLQTPLLDCRRPGYRNDLQGNGFAFLHRPLRQRDLGGAAVSLDVMRIDDPSHKLLAYLDDAHTMAKDYTGADRVIVFDWRFRKAVRQDLVDGFDQDKLARAEFTRPAYKAHSDLSPRGGWLTLKEYLTPDEYFQVESGKMRAQVYTQVVSQPVERSPRIAPQSPNPSVRCWRPLVPVVTDCPLAFCVKGTTDDDDIVPFDRVDGTDAPGEGMFLKYNPQQQWQWLSKQTRDEVSFFLSWDSQEASYKANTFHAAFWHPESSGQGRISIDIRLIGLYARD